VAQTKYLVAKTDTDLDGRAAVNGLAPGDYWISSLNLDANAGDTHVRWDVPINIQAGQTTRLELTNLNAADPHATDPHVADSHATDPQVADPHASPTP
jgi:uncharacterized surface anchored protein